MSKPVSRRKFLTSVLAAAGSVGAATLLEACGGAPTAQAPASTAGSAAAPASASTSAPAGGGQITLTMWDSNTFADLAKGLDKIMADYTKVAPNVKLNLVHNQDLTKTLTAISAGTGPD